MKTGRTVERDSKPLSEREHVVYRFRSADGTLLYVGMSSDLPGRLRVHAAEKTWPEVAQIESERYPDQRSAAAAEAVAIISEEPRYNRDGANIGLDDLIAAVRARIRADRRDRIRRSLRRATSAYGISLAVYWAFASLAVFVLAPMAFLGAHAHGESTFQATGLAVMIGCSYFAAALAPVCRWSVALSCLSCTPMLLFAWIDHGVPEMLGMMVVAVPAVMGPGLNPMWLKKDPSDFAAPRHELAQAVRA